MGTHMLEVQNLKKTFLTPKAHICAVDNMSFYIDRGETYGLVGESGCGKSTTGRAIVGLTKVSSGSILYDNQDLCQLNEREFLPLRQEIQMVFQDTLSALNPRKRIGDILEEILVIHGEKNGAHRRKQVVETLLRVGLSEEHYFRFPHELSGGQVQRLGIAGALIINPKLIVCDEPVSALDVSIQAQILNMLLELKQQFRLSLLFISHDIGVVRFISDRVGVMYLGSLVEESDTDTLFSNPRHPYTKALFAAAPGIHARHKEFEGLSGEQPVRTEKFAGCAFCTRCPYVTEHCRKAAPEFVEIETGHKVACHHVKHQT